MNDKSGETEDYRSFLVLDEISKNNEITQRDLSKKLGMAVGLVNSYIKNLANKGYITVSSIPRRRYLYYLTPKGFIEQTRLTYHHLQNFTNLYRVARRDFRTLFNTVKDNIMIKKIAFCGIDEVAEIAYLSLNEVGVELYAVIDSDNRGEVFFGHKIVAMEDVSALDFDLVVITSFKSGEVLTASLLEAGVDELKICDISSSGWLDKLKR